MDTEEQDNAMTEARRCTAGFEDGGRGHEPKDARNKDLEAGKGQEMDSPLGPLEGHLNFSPVTPISDF